MSSIDQYASYSNRISDICNELSIIRNRVSSLEERTELRLSDIIADSGPYAAFEAQQAAYRKYFDSLEAESMGCQGDTLGQCDHGCDGISDRGSCIDGRSNRMTDAELQDMLDSSQAGSSGPVVTIDDLKAACASLGTAQCGRPADLCSQCSPAMHEAMSMPACKHGERACKYELSDADSCDYSNKPRREPVDMGDGKYGSDVDSGLGGSTGRYSAEQIKNMAAVTYSMGDNDVYGPVDGRMMSRADVLAAVHAAALPVQVVYCCNGAMYEARP